MSVVDDSRDLAEIERSASEARETELKRAEVERYLNPPPDTPFPLEYAFYLLGNAQGKTVLDLGCGTGDSIPGLAGRGARVVGIDLSPDLIRLAAARLDVHGIRTATLRVGSAYATGLPNASVDVVFCMSLLHHLEIPRAMNEMRRVIRPGGYAIIKEPIRFLPLYDRVRKLFPAHDHSSEYEHPLTKSEFFMMTEGFASSGLRFFRLPFVPLVKRPITWRTSAFLLRAVPALNPFATVAVLKLQMKPELTYDMTGCEHHKHHAENEVGQCAE
jgi:SAM-dependent methyltransferase